MNKDTAVYFKVLARDINYVNRIFEGYEYLGVVSTVDKEQGILAVRATVDTAPIVREVLNCLPVELELLDEYENGTE